jgi:hypothetical protein
MLKRQGIKLDRKKLNRLYKEERLTVRKRGGRKRAPGRLGAQVRGGRAGRVCVLTCRPSFSGVYPSFQLKELRTNG